MPNWASNDLIISAKSKKAIEELKRFKEFALTKNKYPDEAKEYRDLHIDFEKFVPYPEEAYEDAKELEEIERLKKEGKEGEAKKLEICYKLKEKKEFNYYDWKIVNWGTKWNAHYTSPPKEEKNRLVYTFDTAWSPPLPVVLKMSEKFPNLIFKIKYYEQGMGFNGIFECQAGKVIKDVYRKGYRGGRGG